MKKITAVTIKSKKNDVKKSQLPIIRNIDKRNIVKQKKRMFC